MAQKTVRSTSLVYQVGESEDEATDDDTDPFEDMD